MRAIVVSGGYKPSKELLLSYIKKDDFIIGVDKGCNCLYEYEIEPDMILGDFDSAKKEVIESFKAKGTKILTFNPEKDYTDTDLGYEKAKEVGATEILFFGATGSRVDHSLGNVGILLKSLREEVKTEIIDDHNRILLIDKETTFKGKYGELISFHSLSDIVINVNIKGAKYELSNYDMTLLEPRAICNEFIDSDIVISFNSGIIMVIFPVD
ncbi:thiamine diphosphokinase [Clostridium sp. SHJSY1]|uniref:thiamine diphosphokinase n=1 Tax=Clostridium sp. SHJSY1 TaxID=2942483 RepID=UPI0028757CB9|nr:thiamine diphosphokinase [Clostridium sp. SHJSY1]MDS0524935.1 thiamine diphosphokinase [Clostridium sp. SHJSY1]